MNQLPESFYKEDVRRGRDLRLHIWLAAVIAVVSGWTLFGLPGTPIHLLRLPEDLPSFGFGLGDIYTEPDGTLTIQREHYADRMGRYEYSVDGTLHKFKGALRVAENEKMSNAHADLADLQMVNGHTLKVRPSRSYYLERAKYRSDRAKVPQHDEHPPQTMEEIAIEQTALQTKLPDPYVILLVYGLYDTHAYFVLRGHMFYEVLDDSLFHDPDVWVTTDRVHYLSHLHASDTGDKVVVKELKTAPVDLGVKVEYDTALRMDRNKHELYLILATGDRFWFDPVTLKQLRHDKLAGSWEREYASVFAAASKEYPYYAEGTGLALTERGYQRLMRGLAVTFIASLIWLGLELIRAWRSTSGRTTAATS